MKKIIFTVLAVFVLGVNHLMYSQMLGSNINLIPSPKSIVINDGSFTLTNQTKIYFDQYSRKVADYLSEVIKPATDRIRKNPSIPPMANPCIEILK